MIPAQRALKRLTLGAQTLEIQPEGLAIQVEVEVEGTDKAEPAPALGDVSLPPATREAETRVPQWTCKILSL
jgi:hypothetical protein